MRSLIVALFLILAAGPTPARGQYVTYAPAYRPTYYVPAYYSPASYTTYTTYTYYTYPASYGYGGYGGTYSTGYLDGWDDARRVYGPRYRYSLRGR